MNPALRVAFFAVAIAGSVLINADSATAATYVVNRSWSGPGGTASLLGTVDLPLGNYTIMNGAPSPFTAINLTLTVNGTSYSLVLADTSLIAGTGQFLINANASTLIFDTANFGGGTPADLTFKTASTDDRYIIGSDADPHFEAGYTSAGDVLNEDVIFPTVFGTIVPEPSSLVLFSLAAGALLALRRHFFAVRR